MSIQSEITRIASAKSDIADAIEYKGVTVPGGSKIDDMAALIRQIRSGGATIIETPDPAGGTVITIDAEQVVTVSPLSVTQNGTYTANTGYAYNPVTVTVPQTSNDFIVTLTKNAQTGYWEPDKTVAEVYAASSAGKTIGISATDPGGCYPAYPENVLSQSYDYWVLEGTTGADFNFYYTERHYRISSSGTVSLLETFYNYDTSDSTAPASHVPSGEIFYTSTGREIGSAAWRTSSDLTESGATVTAPAGFYLSSASKSVASGTATAPSSISGTAASVSTGTNTLTLTKTVSVTPNVTTAGYVSSGTAGDASVSLTANVTTKAAATITPGTSNQTIASGTYLTGTQTIAGDADLVAGNILSTANIFGVQGSVVIQHYYTGSTTPSSSLGSNGDIYLQTS